MGWRGKKTKTKTPFLSFILLPPFASLALKREPTMLGDIGIIHSRSESVPSGWTAVFKTVTNHDADLNIGAKVPLFGGSKLYVCVRPATSQDDYVITNIAVYAEGKEAVPMGHEVIRKSVTGGACVCVCVCACACVCVRVCLPACVLFSVCLSVCLPVLVKRCFLSIAHPLSPDRFSPTLVYLQPRRAT